MQLYSRIVVNLLVILVTTLVNLLAKLTKIRLRGGAWGGLPPLREPLPDCILAPMRNMRNPCPSARIGVDGETTYEAYETYETLVRLMRHMEASEGNKTATPLRLSISFPTFLGELDSRYLEFY